MKRGKKICKALKEVRMQVAKANDIKYAPTECHYEGDCAGTCPKCEGEVRWLEQQLQLRRQLGKAVAVVGVSMGLAALTACDGKFSNRTAGEAEIAPDSLSEVNSAADPCATSPDTVPDSLLAIRQAINSKVAVRDSSDVSEATEPETALIQGEIITGIPEPVSTPSYPGGKQALLDFLKENIKYPEQAKKDSIEGQVVVSFIVKSDGSITNPQVVKSLHPLLDAEALRVINLMPKWKPGSPSRYELPITFKMD